ncbi:MAG: response regulator [Paracoccaceae bacterium]|nr:response regulator [Paracoccaceae bacterium]
MTIRVLAIDDSRTMRDMLYRALMGAGFEVELAEDGEAGLSCMEVFTPDIVVTDLNMPNLNGLQYVEAVRGMANWRGLPILILTTESAAELKAEARRVGATGWIVKPFDEEKLVTAIRRLAA